MTHKLSTVSVQYAAVKTIALTKFAVVRRNHQSPPPGTPTAPLSPKESVFALEFINTIWASLIIHYKWNFVSIHEKVKGLFHTSRISDQ